MSDKAYINTDKVIYTMKDTHPFDYGYMPTLEITRNEELAINVGGFVITMPIIEWFEIGKKSKSKYKKIKDSDK